MLDRLKTTIGEVISELAHLAKNPDSPADLTTIIDMLFWVIHANLDTMGARRGIITVIKLALTDLDSCWDYAAARGFSSMARHITQIKHTLHAALIEQYD